MNPWWSDDSSIHHPHFLPLSPCCRCFLRCVELRRRIITPLTQKKPGRSHILSPRQQGEAQRGRQRNRLPVGSGEVLCGSHFSTAPERMMGKYYGCENNRFKKKGKICTYTTVYKKICEMYCILLAFTSSYHQFWCINAQAKFSSFVQYFHKTQHFPPQKTTIFS